MSNTKLTAHQNELLSNALCHLVFNGSSEEQLKEYLDLAISKLQKINEASDLFL